MITNPSTDKLLEKTSNSYELVNIISKRARQLSQGRQAMVNTQENSDITIASLEFYEEKLFSLNKEEND